jgi:DNA-binding HxlR family transcriptional regulator
MMNPDHDRPTPDQQTTSGNDSLSDRPLSTDYAAYIAGERLACAVEATLDVISGRWKVLIFRELLQGTKRFNELQRAMQGITHKMLTQQLRDMEADGIVQRHVYQQLPLRVDYSLTPLGKTLHPIIDAMHRWGTEYLRQGFSED